MIYYYQNKKSQRFDFQSTISVIFVKYYSMYIFFHATFSIHSRFETFETRLDKNLPPTFNCQSGKKVGETKTKSHCSPEIGCSSPVSYETLPGKKTVAIISRPLKDFQK